MALIWISSLETKVGFGVKTESFLGHSYEYLKSLRGWLDSKRDLLQGAEVEESGFNLRVNSRKAGIDIKVDHENVIVICDGVFPQNRDLSLEIIQDIYGLFGVRTGVRLGYFVSFPNQDQENFPPGVRELVDEYCPKNIGDIETIESNIVTTEEYGRKHFRFKRRHGKLEFVFDFQNTYIEKDTVFDLPWIEAMSRFLIENGQPK